MMKMLINTIIIYTVLILLFRVMGKRQLGDIELSELIVTILISDMASVPMSDPSRPIWEGILPVLTLLGLSFLVSYLSMRWVRFRAFVSGKPTLLIVHGRIDQTQMRRNRFTPDELTEALRNQGFLDLNAVEYAILETDGSLNIIQRPEDRPVTAGQMGIQTEDVGYPIMVINNGRVLSDNLRLLGRDERWLQKQLRQNGLSAPEDVYLMTADMAGGIFLAPRET